MASSFRDDLPIILAHEGGKVDDKDDPGKRTAFGVIQSTYDGWRKANGLLERDVWLIEMGEIEAIYHTRFWLRGHCDELEDPLALIHFDGCVNHGTEPKDAKGNKKISGIVLLQRALKVSDDGIFGIKTAGAAAKMFPTDACYRLIIERVLRYDQLVDQNPKLGKFLTGGWLGRLEHLYRGIE